MEVRQLNIQESLCPWSLPFHIGVFLSASKLKWKSLLSPLFCDYNCNRTFSGAVWVDSHGGVGCGFDGGWPAGRKLPCNTSAHCDSGAEGTLPNNSTDNVQSNNVSSL